MNKNGFTLLELLIVLGVVIVLLGLGGSEMFRMYARNQLKSTTQNLQNILYRTRLDAMKSGKAIVFRYQYGSSLFEILPKEVFEQREKNREGLGVIAVGPELLTELVKPLESITPEQKTPTAAYQRTLPPPIIFGKKPPQNSVETLFEIPLATPSEMSVELAESDENWSPPILFFPNGRTSQTILTLQTTGRYSFRQELILRGLTGTTKIGNQ
jgi:type II secretory pathway pseudopilin PulG